MRLSHVLGGSAACAVATLAFAGGPIELQPASGEPLLGLTPDQVDRFFIGQLRYNTPLQVSEGLGPVFNKESCGNCHSNPLGGPGSQTVTRFGLEDKGTFDGLADLGGSLLQAQAISEDCQEVIPEEANVTSPRLTIGSMGYGLIESIVDADILALEATPGVSGRARTVELLEAPGTFRVGKFGWKAGVATVLSFSGDAAQNEMGLSNRLIPFDNDPNGINPPELGAPDNCDTVPDPEDFADSEGYEFIDRITDFQRFMTAPPQTPRSGMTGEAIFVSTGCAQCHTQSFVTSNDPTLEAALRGKPIQPYSDFLLHDMGLAADFIPDGIATDREIKTTPLWGLRRRDPMWHDGRFAAGSFSDRVNAAIAEHAVFGSEAQAIGNAYLALPQGDKDALVAFLDSLGRQEFDMNGDNDVDLDDFAGFAACFGGGPYTPDDPCAVADIDQDGDVDLDDGAFFIQALGGFARDCNENGQADLLDIAAGISADVDGNLIPDECELCTGDFDGNGSVGFSDLVQLLSAWGPCLACIEDLDGSGAVGFNDLVSLLSAWGLCK